MKYYITDANFNVLSVHPDRDSAKAVWDVNWKAGVDVYLESEDNHLKNIEWVKAYKQRAIDRKKKREDIAIRKSLNEIKVNHELFESAENNVKPMSFEFEEAAQREAEEENNK